MNKRSKIGLISGGVILTAAIIYFGLMPFDYKVHFKTNNTPWIIYHFIEINHESTQFIGQKENHLSFSSRPKDEATYHYVWHLAQDNEGKTKVEVNAVFTKNRFFEKIAMLFGESVQVKAIINELNSFNLKLSETSKDYRWEQPLQATLLGQTCLCASITSRIEDKANEMNKTISFLSSYLPKGKKPPPRLYINEIDLIAQTMRFDFCFPLEKGTLTNVDDNSLFITFKPKIFGEVTSFYGNYSQTHRGWYDYMAKYTNNLKPKLPIVEVFYDSPFGGIEQTKWKSEIYFSINKSNKR